MDSPKPRYWNQTALEAYLGGPKEDVKNVRRALRQLMKSHGKLNSNFKKREAKHELKHLLLSNLDKLPPLVHDAPSNNIRMDGLMGLAYKINNMQKQYGRDKQASLTTPPGRGENGDDSDEDGAEGSDNEMNAGPEPSQSQPRPKPNGTSDRDGMQDTRGLGKGHNIAHGTRSDHSRASDIRTNRSISAVVDDSHATEPQNKRIRTLPPQQEPEFRPPPPQPSQRQSQSLFQPHLLYQPQPQNQELDLLARNIWVVNEVNHESHGLCPFLELTENSTKDHLRISDLDFDRWVSIVQVQCGYDYTIHRLEYRPSPTVIMPVMMAQPITVPMRTPSQWRGALNSQLRSSPDQDPVFHMVALCKSTLHWGWRE